MKNQERHIPSLPTLFFQKKKNAKMKVRDKVNLASSIAWESYDKHIAVPLAASLVFLAPFFFCCYFFFSCNRVSRGERKFVH